MRIKQTKRIISLLIILLIASSLFAASAVKYDQFINQATEFFGSYLSSDIKVTLVNVESEYPEFSEELLNDLEKKLINFGCTVLDRKNTDAIVAELEFQSSGLVDDREAVSIGHMLGADMIIVGKATNKGDYMKLELSLIDISTTLVVRKEDWNIKYDDTLISLMKGEGNTIGNKL
ncbi:MAG: penicillin-binding protein activator LpoB, partial [Spirochaetales bacterium]|nr:penicillin-binding protein activator LpoB [Spirochaetales bacterium]